MVAKKGSKKTSKKPGTMVSGKPYLTGKPGTMKTTTPFMKNGGKKKPSKIAPITTKKGGKKKANKK